MAVVSETNRFYSFTTAKMKPLLKTEAGKALIETCLDQRPSNSIEHQRPKPIEQQQRQPNCMEQFSVVSPSILFGLGSSGGLTAWSSFL